ncbi:MAG: class I SAM-dependent methyltransferase [Haliea sp.]|nr:MAG: class I SAM-dependent methyltransferase [Haliea sp.]
MQRSDMLLAAVHQLRWYPGSISVDDREITVEGWALSAWEDQDQLRFLINGAAFEQIEWPLPSADLLPFFDGVRGAEHARFRCRHSLGAGSRPFEGGFARFNVTTQFGEHAHSYKTAWYLADPDREPPMPSPAQIARVIGAPDEAAYRFGGATLAMRLDQYLRHRFGRPVAAFDSVLDWGCGAGRLSRYLCSMSSHVTGIDIDGDNIAMCASHFPLARFLQVDRTPPTQFGDGSFDLVFGLSVLTHLGEASQHAWLAELRRIARPGCILLLSVQGQAQAHLYKDWGPNRPETFRKGFHVAGINPQLDDVVASAGYYQDVQHSHDYILATWSRYFDVLDIVPALGCPQDVVVLQAREP